MRKYGNVLNVISNGRNFNVRFGLITQFPANVDKAPVKISQQRYFGLTTEKNDITYVKSFLNDKKDVDTLRNLGKLEYLYQYKGKVEKVTVGRYHSANNANRANSANKIEPIQAISYGYSWSYDL